MAASSFSSAICSAIFMLCLLNSGMRMTSLSWHPGVAPRRGEADDLGNIPSDAPAFRQIVEALSTPTMFQQQPHFQQPQQPMMAFPTMGQAPAKKRTLNDEEDADELPASQAPQVVVQQQAVGPQGESVYTEVKGKKTRVASFFEDTDYSAELKASRNAIYGIDTAMEEQQEEDDFDYDEAEASYVPRCESNILSLWSASNRF